MTIYPLYDLVKALAITQWALPTSRQVLLITLIKFTISREIISGPQNSIIKSHPRNGANTLVNSSRINHRPPKVANGVIQNTFSSFLVWYFRQNCLSLITRDIQGFPKFRHSHRPICLIITAAKKMVSGLKMPLISSPGDTLGEKVYGLRFKESRQPVLTLGKGRTDGRTDGPLYRFEWRGRIVNHIMLIFCGVHQVYGESLKY